MLLFMLLVNIYITLIPPTKGKYLSNLDGFTLSKAISVGEGKELNTELIQRLFLTQVDFWKIKSNSYYNYNFSETH